MSPLCIQHRVFFLQFSPCTPMNNTWRGRKPSNFSRATKNTLTGMSFGVKKNTPMRGRIPASRRKEKYRKIQIRPPSFPVFFSDMYDKLVSDDSRFTPPSKGVRGRKSHLRPTPRQELSGWRMAPPGGSTGEQRLLPARKRAKEACSTPSYLSLSLPAP